MKVTIVMNDLSCPVSADRVDENATRIVAAIVIVVTVTALYSGFYWLSLLLAADFGLRAFTQGNYSLLKNAAKFAVTQLALPPKPVDAAPKKFAAGVGLAFALAIGIAQFFGFTYTAYGIGSVLLLCAFLESAFAYCVGCVVYTYLVLPVLNRI